MTFNSSAVYQFGIFHTIKTGPERYTQLKLFRHQVTLQITAAKYFVTSVRFRTWKFKTVH